MGLSQITLLMFLSFPQSHAFWDAWPTMIWDANSSCMEEPNSDEREWAMGFFTSIITMLNISEGVNKRAHIGACYES